MNTMVGKEAPETFSRGSEIPPSIWLATMQQPIVNWPGVWAHFRTWRGITICQNFKAIVGIAHEE